MYVIDVIPLCRTAPGTLTYRSKEAQVPGSIVHITLRKKVTQGIVIACVPVSDAKEMIKHARFLLSKSIPSSAGVLPEAVIQAATETAGYHGTSAGAVLSAVFSEYAKLEIPLPTVPYTNGIGYIRESLEMPITERAEIYRKKLAEAIKAGNSLLLVVPTVPELLYWKEFFAGIKPLIVSGSVTGAARIKALTAAATHQGLIITTPSFSWVPIERLGGICIERVSAGTYILPKRPYLSMVHALESLARARNIPCILADYPLPLEYRSSIESPLVSNSPVPITAVDARRPKDSPDADAPWTVLPASVTEQIAAELAEGGKVVVLSARKGYSPSVVCRDCGQAQTDERGVPLTFSIAGGKRTFITSDGVSELSVKRTCSRCESWNLLPLGIGVERVEEELRKVFPNAHILTATAEILSGPRKVKAFLEEASQPGSILIGTEALLPWLYTHGHQDYLGIIASADSLLALPFWRARERFVRLSYFLSGLCKKVVLVTRHPEDVAVTSLSNPESAEFWKEEAQLRNALGYPPFGTIISLSVEGSAAAVERMMESLAGEHKEYSPAVLPVRNSSAQAVRGSLILMLPEGSWPNTELATYLGTLPPSVRLRVDPESFW